ncbi:MAG: sarcosine oxidase subunit gamma [Alphaproteobacteria bacterium]|nr:sarcosine oxidase subunit gamma [Alphaproteobacteria bacterium]
MADRNTALRAAPLDGRLVRSAHVEIVPADVASRIVLRARPEAIAPLSRALGVKLPEEPKTSAKAKASRLAGRIALWIGPDEWLVVDPNGADLMALCSKVKKLHSAVDVSHRNTAILVAGEAAQSVISAGCPQDLSPNIFPVGACSRTVLGKAEIVLVREDAHVFRVECWRSFSDYVFAFLADAARDAVI